MEAVHFSGLTAWLRGYNLLVPTYCSLLLAYVLVNKTVYNTKSIKILYVKTDLLLKGCFDVIVDKYSGCPT